jgi:hypothetical protein
MLLYYVSPLWRLLLEYDNNDDDSTYLPFASRYLAR